MGDENSGATWNRDFYVRGGQVATGTQLISGRWTAGKKSDLCAGLLEEASLQ